MFVEKLQYEKEIPLINKISIALKIESMIKHLMVYEEIIDKAKKSYYQIKEKSAGVMEENRILRSKVKKLESKIKTYKWIIGKRKEEVMSSIKFENDMSVVKEQIENVKRDLTGITSDEYTALISKLVELEIHLAFLQFMRGVVAEIKNGVSE